MYELLSMLLYDFLECSLLLIVKPRAKCQAYLRFKPEFSLVVRAVFGIEI